MALGVDQMRSDVVLDDLGHQTRHRSARAGDEVKDLVAARFCVQRPFDRLDLTADPADAGQKLVFLANGVGHVAY